MKKEVLILIVILSLSIIACNPDRPFRVTCSDKVRIHVLDATNSEHVACYDDRGKTDIVVVNNGKLDIESMTITMVGDKNTTNVTVNAQLRIADSQMISLNFQKSRIGVPKKIYIYPSIEYDGGTRLCEFNRYAVLDLQECGSYG